MITAAGNKATETGYNVAAMMRKMRILIKNALPPLMDISEAK